jgi:hypothetical protein
MYYFIIKVTDYFFIYSFTKSQLNSSEVLERFDIPKENSKKVETILFLKNIKPKQSLTYYKYEFSIPKDLEPIIMDIFKYELDKWRKSWPTYKWVGSIDGKNVI